MAPRKNDRLFIGESPVELPVSRAAAAGAQRAPPDLGPSQRGGTLYNTSPLGSLRDANGPIYIRVGGRKLLCFEQFPESILFIP